MLCEFNYDRADLDRLSTSLLNGMHALIFASGEGSLHHYSELIHVVQLSYH